MSQDQAAASTNAFLTLVAPTVPRTSPCFRKRQFPGIFSDSLTSGPRKERLASFPEEKSAEPISPEVASVGEDGKSAKACLSRREADAYASSVETSFADSRKFKLKTRNPFAFSKSKPTPTVRGSMEKQSSLQ
eukprot:gnl/TRDRNA2_/TRDRNA2_177296_c1_seq4.p1 gnl/TRDRNA2_/TRDRNA2_177296_c1~~gnl/TRDRNA2_/TRDRNA2_177296_c1_seq4.p1  ORF type:complete len:133 (-),score=25.62 gnl/TRDRNA2_/TRDRNA2_177296_c1_seq4:167-565(-)